MRDMFFTGNEHTGYTLWDSEGMNVIKVHGASEIEFIDWTDEYFKDLEPTEEEKDLSRYMLIEEVTRFIFKITTFEVQAYDNKAFPSLHIGVRTLETEHETGKIYSNIKVCDEGLKELYSTKSDMKFEAYTDLFELFAKVIDDQE